MLRVKLPARNHNINSFLIPKTIDLLNWKTNCTQNKPSQENVHIYRPEVSKNEWENYNYKQYTILSSVALKNSCSNQNRRPLYPWCCSKQWNMTPYFKMQCRRAQYWTQHSPSSSCQTAARGENQWPTVVGCMYGRETASISVLCDNHWSITPVGTMFSDATANWCHSRPFAFQ